MYAAHAAAVASGVPKDQAPPKPNSARLHKILVQLKNDKTNPANINWFSKASKCAAQEALNDLEQGFRNYFSNPSHFRRPRYKNTKTSRSFRIYSTSTRIVDNTIQLPLVGCVKLSPGYAKQITKQNLSNIGITIGLDTLNRWFVSFPTAELQVPPLKPNTREIGIDMGVNTFITGSDGLTINHPRPLKSALKQIKKVQRSFSKKKKGSRHRRSLLRKLRKKHNRVCNIRKDFLHKTSKRLALEYTKISIEKLAIDNMTASCKGKGQAAKAGVNRSLLDISISDFFQLLKYKSTLYGCEIVEVNAAYTSQTCSACGHCEKGNRPTQALFSCMQCSYTVNADLNAAINISLKVIDMTKSTLARRRL
jgi:putative transposase